MAARPYPGRTEFFVPYPFILCAPRPLTFDPTLEPSPEGQELKDQIFLFKMFLIKLYRPFL